MLLRTYRGTSVKTVMPDRKLVVIGSGPELKKLQSQATPNVFFLGFVPEPLLIATGQQRGSRRRTVRAGDVAAGRAGEGSKQGARTAVSGGVSCLAA